MAKKPSAKPNEIRIKEGETDTEEFFHRQEDPYVLPPELNMTIKDGFRFGIGFILAMLIFYVIVIIGLVILIRVMKVVQ